jgi:hypothetical protein
MAGTSSEYMPHRGDDLAGSLCLLHIWGANLGETFGEDSTLATGVPATPATLGGKAVPQPVLWPFCETCIYSRLLGRTV